MNFKHCDSDGINSVKNRDFSFCKIVASCTGETILVILKAVVYFEINDYRKNGKKISLYF